MPRLKLEPLGAITGTLVDASGNLLLPAVPRGTTKVAMLEELLLKALLKNRLMQLEVERWRRDAADKTSKATARFAWEIASRAVTWQRGRPPKAFVAFLKRRLGPDGAALLLQALAPRPVGSRGSVELLWKTAYTTITGKGADSKYRGVRGSLAKLMLETRQNYDENET